MRAKVLVWLWKQRGVLLWLTESVLASELIALAGPAEESDRVVWSRSRQQALQSASAGRGTEMNRWRTLVVSLPGSTVQPEAGPPCARKPEKQRGESGTFSWQRATHEREREGALAPAARARERLASTYLQAELHAPKRRERSSVKAGYAQLSTKNGSSACLEGESKSRRHLAADSFWGCRSSQCVTFASLRPGTVLMFQVHSRAYPQSLYS